MVETIGWWVRRKDQKVFTQLQLTSQLTCTHWVNLSKKELVSCFWNSCPCWQNHVRTWSYLLLRRPWRTWLPSRKDVDFVNKSDWRCSSLPTLTVTRHMYVTLPEQDAFTLGYTIYFELAIALQVTWMPSTHLTNQVLKPTNANTSVCPSLKAWIWRIEQRIERSPFNTNERTSKEVFFCIVYFIY